MSLVENYRQIERNLSALEAVRASGSGTEFEDYRGLIRRGRVMLPYLAEDGIAFAPSRFIGYSGNTVAAHLSREDRDGKITNKRITEILRSRFRVSVRNVPDSEAEAHFVRFCGRLGTAPGNAARTYWIPPNIGEWLSENRADHGHLTDEELELQVRDNEALPPTTREAIIRARVGQGLFRRRVLQAYDRCLITGLKDERLLVASHIKPWRDCRDEPGECLNPDNALLLSPTWDALFDKGFISFQDDGTMLVSRHLSGASRKVLAVGDQRRVSLNRGQVRFMSHHRELHGFE